MTLPQAVAAIHTVFTTHVNTIRTWYENFIFDYNTDEHELQCRAEFILQCAVTYPNTSGFSEVQLLRHLRDLSGLTKIASELVLQIQNDSQNFNISIDDIRECKFLPTLNLTDLGNHHLFGELS